MSEIKPIFRPCCELRCAYESTPYFKVTPSRQILRQRGWRCRAIAMAGHGPRSTLVKNQCPDDAGPAEHAGQSAKDDDVF
jgi:hypothetical protein